MFVLRDSINYVIYEYKSPRYCQRSSNYMYISIMVLQFDTRYTVVFHNSIICHRPVAYKSTNLLECFQSMLLVNGDKFGYIENKIFNLTL